MSFEEFSDIELLMSSSYDQDNEKYQHFNFADDTLNEINVYDSNQNITFLTNSNEQVAMQNEDESTNFPQNTTQISPNPTAYSFNNCTNNKFDSNQGNNSNHSIEHQKKRPKYNPHSKWSKEDDEKLKKLVEEFGEKNWRHLAKKMEGRNSRQCRERWQYYLNPSLIQGRWTQEEDYLIFKLRNEFGPRWMQISKYFKHRTDAMIKNRYNLLMRTSIRERKKELIRMSNTRKTKTIELQLNSSPSINEINDCEEIIFSNDETSMLDDCYLNEIDDFYIYYNEE